MDSNQCKLSIFTCMRIEFKVCEASSPVLPARRVAGRVVALPHGAAVRTWRMLWGQQEELISHRNLHIYRGDHSPVSVSRMAGNDWKSPRCPVSQKREWSDRRKSSAPTSSPSLGCAARSKSVFSRRVPSLSPPQLRSNAYSKVIMSEKIVY